MWGLFSPGEAQPETAEQHVCTSKEAAASSSDDNPDEQTHHTGSEGFTLTAEGNMAVVVFTIQHQKAQTSQLHQTAADG